MKKLCVLFLVFICSLVFVSCKSDDTYKLAKQIRNYKLTGEGYEETLEMARKGNYDANCKDCFKGIDTSNISLFAYACEVDFEIAKAIYENGADIEVSNPEFPETPLLAATRGNRNNPDIVYWLIDQGADINAVSFDKCSVFQNLRFWEDNEDTWALIRYFKENCDLEYLKTSTEGTLICSWDELWNVNGEFNFYKP
ncbi:MAG: hypothetical protein KBT01_04550 [Clostridiales bacterium]|nr:hypothetical protein [Candidatus Blautia equi]